MKRLWNEDFIPAISVLKGEAKASGARLRSVDEYRNIAPTASKLNYYMWKFQWFPYYEGLGGSYTSNLDGQINYMYDWTVGREKWMTKMINDSESATEKWILGSEIGWMGR